MKIEKGILLIGVLAVVMQLSAGCSAGAGYAVKASTADALTSSGMKSILDIAKTQSDAHADLGVGKLKSELEAKILDLDSRVKKLETK